MRKLSSLVFVALLLLLAALPSVAQDQTIADIVVESSSAATPEFTTLLAAVQAADPAVLEALSNPEAELTVFAPTDAAFAALAEALGEEAFAAVLADTPALTNILLFHAVPGVFSSADVVATLEAGEGRFSVPTAMGQYIDVEQTEDGAILVNGAVLNLEMLDIEASNGVIHVIDAVILPETKTIAEIVIEATGAETPEFTTLLAAVQAADPSVVELLSDAEAELTVFAPTDAAFAALTEALGAEALGAILADPEQLTPILTYHVVAGKVYSQDIVTALTPMEEGAMMEMPEWYVGMTDEGGLEILTANGTTAVISATEDGIFINDAQIVVTDIDAANGVIHVIDAVIVPPTE